MRDVGVELVREVEIDALDAEPPQARLDLSLDPRATEAVVGARFHRVERLRLDGDRVAHRRALLREPLADPALAATAAVGVCRVERPDPELPARVHDPERLVVRDPLPEERRRRADAAEVAAAEDDPRDGDPAPPELPPLHRAILRRAGAWIGRVGRRASTSTPRSGAERADDEDAVVADGGRPPHRAQSAPTSEAEIGERAEGPDDGAAVGRRPGVHGERHQRRERERVPEGRRRPSPT